MASDSSLQMPLNALGLGNATSGQGSLSHARSFNGPHFGRACALDDQRVEDIVDGGARPV
jgi:hypothetical protein